MTESESEVAEICRTTRDINKRKPLSRFRGSKDGRAGAGLDILAVVLSKAHNSRLIQAIQARGRLQQMRGLCPGLGRRKSRV